MGGKATKCVLIVDDESGYREGLEWRFKERNTESACPYEFEVETASSGNECTEKVRAKELAGGFDVIVLDVRMESEKRGLEENRALGDTISGRSAVRVIFTGYPVYSDCVSALRHGAWDYITKEDEPGGRLAVQKVIDCAIARLRQIDLQEKHTQLIAQDWLPLRFFELQREFAGKMVALWHHPQVEVICVGRDAFDLEQKLRQWRQDHQQWELPFVVRIPHVLG